MEGLLLPMPYALKSTISLLLAMSFLNVALSFRRGYRYFITLSEAPFLVRTRENIFEHRTINESYILSALVINAVLCGGIIMFFTLCRTGYADCQNWQLPLALSIICTALFATCQYIMYKLTGYVFGDEGRNRTWIEGNNAGMALLGIVLLPIAMTITLHGAPRLSLIIVAFVLFLISKIIFIIKGIRIFFNKIDNFYLFISYLCGVEIVPLLIYLMATVSLL